MRNDYSFNLRWEGGQYDQYDDHVFSASIGARVSDPFHTYGIGLEKGQRAGHPLTFLTPYVRWRFGNRFTLGVSSSLLYHSKDQYQHIATFNYDFTPERGLSGRVVAQTGSTNGYVAYRQSGYGGVEKWVIVGDPNARKFTSRLAVKVVWPL
jgi:hypothetical protein